MSIFFFLAAFFSEVVGTIVGFGSSTIFLPLTLLFVDFQTALVLVAFLHIFGNLGRVSFFKSGLDRNLIIKFGIPSVILTLIGALLVSSIPQNTLKAILGLFLIGYSSYSLLKEDFSVPATTVNAIIGGGLSGFFAGLIGTGGALRGAFLTGFKLPKEKYIATSAAVALAVDFTRIPVYISEGFLKSGYYFYLPILFVIAILGSLTGRKVVKKLPFRQFRKFVFLAVLLIGIKFIYDWAVQTNFISLHLLLSDLI